MRIRGLVLLLAVSATFALALPAAAQVPTTTPPVQCSKVVPTVVFRGTVTSISGSIVTFDVTAVVSGTGASGTSVPIVYPTEYNARKLAKGAAYRVAATTDDGHLLSVVPTAQITACGQSTRHADGTAIDTSALAGVKQLLPRDAERVGLGVLAVLVVLILIGRVFDRRSRYQ